MDYNKIIEAIERDIEYSYHFTDYDFGQILKIKCPRPAKSISLRYEYFTLMDNLKEFLRTSPSKELLSAFILKSVKELDPSKYLVEEFELLILKYNGVNYFGLGIDIAREYFYSKKNELEYSQPIKKY